MSISKPLTIAASAAIVATALGTCFNEYVDGVTVLLYKSGAMSRDALVESLGVRVPTAATVLPLLLAAVLFMVWTGRARRNLDSIAGAAPTYTPGWTVGAWFIPLGSLIMPALVIADIAKHSTPDERARRRLMVLVWIWWSCWIAHQVGVSAFGIAVAAGTNPTLYGAVEVAVATVYVVAAVFVVMLMVSVGRAQAVTLNGAEITDRPNPAHFPTFTVEDAATAAAITNRSRDSAMP